jgi:hypothetical protein
MKRTLNKWQFIYSNMRDYARMDCGWKQFRIGVIRLKSAPQEGDMLMKYNYDGFILSFNYWFPIDSIKIN